MLSINFIRKNPKKIKEAAQKKHMDFDVDDLLEIDKKRRQYIEKVEKFQAQKNKLGKEDRDKAKEIKKKIKELKPKLDKVKEEYKKLMLQVPNVPDSSV
ncbi:MAG: serine--tRNA ligase, partial [Minisyncoccales bacterium]